MSDPRHIAAVAASVQAEAEKIASTMAALQDKPAAAEMRVASALVTLERLIETLAHLQRAVERKNP